MKTIVVAVATLGSLIGSAVYLSGAGVPGPAHDRSPRALRGPAANVHARLMQLADVLPGRETLDRRRAGRRGARTRRWRPETPVRRSTRGAGANTLALGTPGWEPMIEIGDAALRVATRSPARRVDEASAREAYLLALVRARRAGSLGGIASGWRRRSPGSAPWRRRGSSAPCRSGTLYRARESLLMARASLTDNLYPDAANVAPVALRLEPRVVDARPGTVVLEQTRFALRQRIGIPIDVAAAIPRSRRRSEVTPRRVVRGLAPGGRPGPGAEANPRA